MYRAISKMADQSRHVNPRMHYVVFMVTSSGCLILCQSLRNGLYRKTLDQRRVCYLTDHINWCVYWLTPTSLWSEIEMCCNTYDFNTRNSNSHSVIVPTPKVDILIEILSCLVLNSGITCLILKLQHLLTVLGIYIMSIILVWCNVLFFIYKSFYKNISTKQSAIEHCIFVNMSYNK